MFDRCLYFNTNHLSRLIGKIWLDAFADIGLAPAHAYLVRLVLTQPGLAQKDIALELHLEKSTITRFIDKMVEQGYVERHLSNNKEQQIFATQKAKNIANQLESIGDNLYNTMSSAIGKDKLKTLVKNIQETTESINSI